MTWRIGKVLVAAVLGVLASLPAYSGPMGFKDSWMAMGDFGPNWKEAFANYALTPRDAVGASALSMRSDDRPAKAMSATVEVVGSTYTRLCRQLELSSMA